MSGLPPPSRVGPLEVALALPVLAGLAAAALILAATLIGYRALAAPLDLTMSEAAVLRDEAEVLRQIANGSDPNVAQPIRPGIFNDDSLVMTPFEAAIAARHVEVVQLLAGNGARLDESNLPRLICLARRSAAADILAFLEARSASSPAADCSGVRLPW